MFSLVHARLLPNKQKFETYFRFELEIDHARDLQRWSKVELIVHHDTYTRTVVLPVNEEPRYDYATFVQYGHGIDFNEIEVSLVDNHGIRSEPQFYTVPYQPVIELEHRHAQREKDHVA